ncbi:uncharacterized protein BCR38DRAFT_244308 [Pseudomassariella vexata]|uniref:Zn(2)-C6 fungal-type domain-containing protein n=1 Tax=Pseudomassariella vexata TaxID=1141098 RepID=A0A1Y2DTM3_9PEZI|nr:uncharacterized protein BCR38DRAFT_244308 [Pseudomassariella vexata]ORY62633.1 hypothetical protein BCR38DRAFT_244308 [Pseudomassariella vexata]
MSGSSVVSRTAPIAIAPKPSKPTLSPSRQHSTLGTNDHLSNSMNGHDSADSEDSPLSGSLICKSCLRRRIKCILSEDEDSSSSCLSCQVNGIECSLNRSPQPRKRKLPRDCTDDISQSWKRA